VGRQVDAGDIQDRGPAALRGQVPQFVSCQSGAHPPQPEQMPLDPAQGRDSEAEIRSAVRSSPRCCVAELCGLRSLEAQTGMAPADWPSDRSRLLVTPRSIGPDRDYTNETI